MKTKYIADTVAIVLRLEKRKMPKKAKELFEKAENGHIEISVPAMVFAEIGYLAEKNRIEIKLKDVKNYLKKFDKIIEQPLTLNVVENAFNIYDIPELHDRLISATAMEFDTEIITNDPEIQRSKYVKTIWD